MERREFILGLAFESVCQGEEKCPTRRDDKKMLLYFFPNRSLVLGSLWEITHESLFCLLSNETRCLDDDVIDALDGASHHGEQANVAEGTIRALLGLTGGVTLQRRRRTRTIECEREQRNYLQLHGNRPNDPVNK